MLFFDHTMGWGGETYILSETIHYPNGNNWFLRIYLSTYPKYANYTN